MIGREFTMGALYRDGVNLRKRHRVMREKYSFTILRFVMHDLRQALIDRQETLVDMEEALVDADETLISCCG